MSAVLGVFAAAGEGGHLPDAAARAMLERMSARGADQSEIRRSGGALLAVVRHDWELGAGFSGPVLVATDGDLLVAADASLYYRDDLRRALAARGVEPVRDTPAHLILAAYRAWGERCAEHLEGDFAFVLWDGAQRTVVAARDFGGKRSLFYAEAGPVLLVATELGALLRFPGFDPPLNLTEIAASAAVLLAVEDETAYEGVCSLPAGRTLVRRGASLRMQRHWTPPPVDASGALPFEKAAEELRGLIFRAVEERLDPSGPTAVWLSGGRDSGAVFAAGEEVHRRRGDGQHMLAVSTSYPPGDSGREDETIEAVVRRWGSPHRWVRSGDVPLLDDAVVRAARRDEPQSHAFEISNRTLARTARDGGARVVFEGNGGDQLFQVSDLYFADLFWSGGWRELRREWNASYRRGTGFRSFFLAAVRPSLPGPALEVARVLRGGRPLGGYVLDRVLPDWISPEFAARHHLLERERASAPRRGRTSHADFEMQWFLTTAYGPRIISLIHAFGVESGIEPRSPLYDERVIRFAASRPRAERRSGTDTKRLLRRSMAGLLPDEVLAPRTYRSGTTHDYFSQSLRGRYGPDITSIFAGPLALAQVGIVCADVLRQRWHDYLERNQDELGLQLFLTLQTELWLRARIGQPDAARSEPAPRLATVGT